MLSFPIRQIAEVANLDKTARQHVQQKTTHELHRLQGHDLLFVAVGRIAPTEGHLAVFEAQNSSVGDGDPMRVVGQILHHVLWPGKRLFGLDHPLLLFQKPGQAIKSFPLLQGCEGAGEPQLTTPIGPA